ncbi:hypothetical protein G9U51_09740 [Calidifontibacter sp. DB0510]|uniref:DUF3757 domain-containing protein n=1 Tax=Metallococcus carri TaxID=1656884 RepID=A0A967EEW5_9MICO|nr:hypothetical protein [Metallococcus carri]NHN56056.1 hypothetical protein [Metallococcus carri]NOP37487.1 hypothetical protein [Calidifontibacter sp. DB2511S]
MKRSTTKKYAIRGSLIAGAIVPIVALTTMPHAAAATGWSGRTTGAYAIGTWTRSGSTYTMSYVLRDTRKDGHDVYVRFVPQYYDGDWGEWHSVGYPTVGYSERYNNRKGVNREVRGVASINIPKHFTWYQRRVATKVRMEMKVCREIKGVGKDNCAKYFTPAHRI